MRHDTIERICRLTPLQDGMFFEALRKQGSSEVVYQVCLELSGAIRPALLREAWRTAIRRHPMLRTSFHYERLDAPVQVTRHDADPPWREVDLRDVPAGEHRARLDELLDADRARPFELTRAPLLRLTLVRGAADRAWLVWTYHHLLLDGWSTYLVLDDVFRAYREFAAGRRPDGAAPRPFWDYVAWLAGRDQRGAEDFWRERLRGLTGPTPLGYEEVPAGAAGAGTAEIAMTLPPDVAGGLDALARRYRITRGTLLNAAWAVVLSRFSGHDDVVFGGIVSGRDPDFRGIDDLVGLFINVQPVRARLRPDRAVDDWLAEFQGQLADARQYDYTPLSTVRRCVDLPRGVPLFESLAVFINYPVRDRWTDGGDVRVVDNRVLQEPHYPLHLTGISGSRGWRLTLGYDTGRFTRTTVSRLGELLTAVLAAIARDPRQSLADLPVWTPTAPLAVLAAAGEPPTRPVADLLAAAAVSAAGGTAVSAGGTALGYPELFARAGHLAAELRSRGAGPDVPVAVWCRTTADTAIATVATVLTGAVLVPLDPADPPALLAAQLATTGTHLLTAGTPTGTPTGTPAGTPADPELAALLAAVATPPTTVPVPPPGAVAPAAPPGAAGPAGPIGVVSGGSALVLAHGDDPGGAVLRQLDLARLLWRLQRIAPVDRRDRVRLAGPAGQLVRNLLWTLAMGATAVLDGPAGAATVAWLARHEIGALAGGLAGGTAPPRRVLCAGGVLPSAVRAAFVADPRVELIEEHPAELGGTVLVGTGWDGPRHCPGDGRLRTGPRVFPAPGAAPVGLTEGDPRLWAVAEVLRRHPAVRDAAARVVTGTDGTPAVLAYLVLADAGGRDVAVAELRDMLADRLPAELSPRTFVTVDAIVRGPDGDLDPAALPAPDGGSPAGAERPADPVADLVAAIWAQILEQDAGRLDDRSNFFDLGGHSLLAIRLVSRLRSALGVDFSLTHLFADPTISGTARAVRALLAGDRPEAAPDRIPPAPRDEPLPASFAQERIWFVDQLGDGPANNVMLPGRLRRPLDEAALRVAVAGLLRRHEALRTCLRERDGAVVQVVLAEPDVPLAVDDLSDQPLEVAERRARQLLERDVTRRFDLATEVPVRVRLVRLAAADTVLAVCVHHAAFDGWSTGVLFRDLGELYDAALAGREPELPPLAVQYADFSRWQRERLTGERLDRLVGYWRERLAGMPERLRLTPMPARPDGERTGGGDVVERDLPAAVASGVRELTAAEGVTPFMVLLAAFAVLLSRRTGRDDVVVGSPLADRDPAVLEPLIGLFVNTQVLRLPLTGGPTFRELLARTREVALGALAHHDLPFGRLVSAVSPDRMADQMPLVQVSFNMQNTPDRPFELAGGAASHFPVRQEVPRFELTAELHEGPGGLRCAFHFAEDVYHRPFVERLADEYADLLQVLLSDPDRPVPLAATADGAPAAADDQDLRAGSRALLRELSRR
jgi:non-ribosomal peptide synthetase component F/acyl carrier protein